MTDPRQHRYVTRINGDRLTYICGCINEIHQPTGALRCVLKCKAHRKNQRSPETLGISYYEELGAIVDGLPQCRRYCDQLFEAVGKFTPADHYGIFTHALEVGCGASMYAAAIQQAGYKYFGVDESRDAARWTEATYLVKVHPVAFEDLQVCEEHFALILAAHTLEHMADAPAVLAKCARCLVASGELWIIVPDDSDPLNPDHTWTFSSDALCRAVEGAGLKVDRLATRKYIERENFIYCRARKP